MQVKPSSGGRTVLRAILPGVLLAAVTATAAIAVDETPRGYACTFKTGSSVAYAKGTYKSKPAQPLVFEVGDIDLDAQTAALVTAKGKGQLRVVRAVNANHFLEAVGEGFLNMTTIYDKDPKRGLHPAVHSRHFGLFGEPQIAQYQGFCSAK